MDVEAKKECIKALKCLADYRDCIEGNCPYFIEENGTCDNISIASDVIKLVEEKNATIKALQKELTIQKLKAYMFVEEAKENEEYLLGEFVSRLEEQTAMGKPINEVANNLLNEFCSQNRIRPEETFQDIKKGDIVIVRDEYSHDYSEHCLKISCIENDKEYETSTNPCGKICYGEDLDEEEWGDNYITVVTEVNFVRIVNEEE